MLLVALTGSREHPLILLINNGCKNTHFIYNSTDCEITLSVNTKHYTMKASNHFIEKKAYHLSEMLRDEKPTQIIKPKTRVR